MWRLLLLVLLATFGCTHTLRPEAYHPTWPEIVALAESIRGPSPPNLTDPTLVVYPSIALSGTNAWITCYVPESLGPGRIRFGIDGLSMSGPSPLERVENRRLLERLPPGEWIATCDIWTWTRHIRLTATLMVIGGD